MQFYGKLVDRSRPSKILSTPREQRPAPLYSPVIEREKKYLLDPDTRYIRCRDRVVDVDYVDVKVDPLKLCELITSPFLNISNPYFRKVSFF